MFLNRVFRQEWFNRFLWFLASLIRKNGRTLRKFYLFSYRYRVFSLTWPASTQIYWNKRKRLHKKRVQLPADWFGTPTWPPFHCFGTPIWPPWRHVKTLYSYFGYFSTQIHLMECRISRNHIYLILVRTSASVLPSVLPVHSFDKLSRES